MTTLAHSAATWEPRRALSLEAARSRSRLIWAMRRVLVGLAGASLASVFVFMALFSPTGLWGPAYGAASPLRVISPRFTGTLESGEAYQLTADVATREHAAARFLELAAPVYRSLKGHTLVAPHGVYDEQTDTVRMDGGVLFSDSAGNRFSSPGMIVDFKSGTVRGDRGVTGAGPLGVVRADTYEIRNSDRAIVLRGHVNGQVPERAEDAPGAAQE
ncbi:MAG: LPS export ABC transporter periplasmic protein LptC [Caulobacterales bacterium]